MPGILSISFHFMWRTLEFLLSSILPRNRTLNFPCDLVWKFCVHLLFFFWGIKKVGLMSAKTSNIHEDLNMEKYSLTWEMYRQGQSQGKGEITKFCDFIFYLILTPEIGKIYIVLGLLRPIEVHRCHVARWLKLFEMLLLCCNLIFI